MRRSNGEKNSTAHTCDFAVVELAVVAAVRVAGSWSRGSNGGGGVVESNGGPAKNYFAVVVVGAAVAVRVVS